MRKLIFTFCCIIPIICSAQVSTKKVFEANKKWSIGLLAGYLHFPNNVNRGAIGGSVIVKGCYFDIMGWGSAHGRDVEVKKWNEDTSLAIHTGYQIPITRSLRFIPVIGYAKAGNTTTDGSNWSVGRDGIVNSQSSSTDASGLDYGGIVRIKVKNVNLFGGCTRFIYYTGIDIEF